MTTPAKFMALLFLGATLAGAGGCATASIAAAGTMAGIAASAVSTGEDIYHLGKLDSADETTYEAWKAACRGAVRELGFKKGLDFDNGKGKWTCVIYDDRSGRTDITVTRQTERVCLTRIDVGLLGSEPTARLILGAARRRAHAATTAPATAPTQPAAPTTLSSELLPKEKR